MTRVMQTDFPRHTLEEALRVARSIWQEYAGDPTPPHDVAVAVGHSPTSSSWRTLSGAAVGYGLTDGAYNAEQIALTELGRRAVAPTAEGESEGALRQALLQPEYMAQVFEKYDRKNLPRDEILRNVLMKQGIPADRVEEAANIIRENGRFTGVFRDTPGNRQFVALDLPSSPAPPSGEPEDGNLGEQRGTTPPAEPEQKAKEKAKGTGPKPIFVGHGKNVGPLEQLKDFLREYGIPHEVVIDQAHLGRPISLQVREAMQRCGSAIIIFTRDQKFLDEDGNEIWRPSENPIHELGAALFAYGNRVVIFKEKGLSLPSNYRDIGHIEFEPDNFKATTADLLKELVGFHLIQITPTSA